MQVLKERFIYFPFEYKAFVPYLKHRASKGWRLKTIEGNWLYSTFVFEACSPQNLQYYTDFSLDSKYYRLREGQKDKTYHSFVEEYGYQYVCDYKGLVVYECTSDTKFELREESSEESKKELRKATRNSLFPFGWIVVYIALIIGTWQCNALTFANYELMIALFTKVLVIIMLLVILYSPIRWMIHPKLQQRMWVIRLRTMAVLSIACLYISQYLSGAQPMLYILLCITSLTVMSVGVFRFCFVSKSRLQKSCLCIGVIACLLIAYVTLSSTTIYERDTLRSIPPFTNQELHKKEQDMLTYHTSGTWLLDVMEVTYTSGTYYTIYYLNKSIAKEYLQASIPYEEKVLHKVDHETYTRYERENDVVFSKEGVIWVMDMTMYRTIPPNELENLFTIL